MNRADDPLWGDYCLRVAKCLNEAQEHLVHMSAIAGSGERERMNAINDLIKSARQQTLQLIEFLPTQEPDT